MLSSGSYTTFVVGFAIMMDSMLYCLVLPFLPEMFTGRLHVPERRVSQWISLSFEAFALTTLLSTALVGVFTDACKSKRMPFLSSGLIMPVSTILFFLATSPVMVAVSRGIQGLSVTFTWVTGLAFLVHQVREDDLGASVGWTTAGVAIGEVVGPLIGGPIYDHLGHWAAFAVVEALLLLDVLLRLSTREKKPGISDAETQPQLESETQAHMSQDNSSETDRLLPHGHADSTDCSHTTDGESKEANSRQDDASTLAWNWLGTMVVLIIIFVVRGAMEIALPLYLTRQYSWSPTNISLTLLGITAPAAISPVIGNIVSRQGPRWWSTGAFAFSGATMISFGFVAGDSSESKTLFVVHSTMVGMALAVLINSTQIAVSLASQRYGPALSRAADRNEKLSPLLSWIGPGTMLSGLTFSWAVGILIGPVYTSLIEYTEDAGWAIFCHGLGGLCLVAALGNSFLWRDW